MGITQIAGGSGTQGLQWGTGTRDGMVIQSATRTCARCDRTTRQDRWTGAWVPATAAGGMPPEFAARVFAVLGSRDVVEGVSRTPGQVTIDHKLPRLRWTPEMAVRQTDYGRMEDSDIERNFQVLKRSNGSVSHNMLKSRACEKCYETGERGTPFGIRYFYDGGERWEPDGKQDPKGCVGCGWFDFAKWRDALNRKLRI